MSDFVEFAKNVEVQLATSNRAAHWEPGEAERYMTEVGARRDRFEALASRLNESVIQPRLLTLAGYFPNASPTTGEPAGRCSCWFGYCERFPANTKVTFAVERDVRYEASMMPQFIKFDEHDKLTVALDEINDAAVAGWVEERLLEFLDAHLQIDRGGEDLDEEATTDRPMLHRISMARKCNPFAGRGRA